MSAGFLSLLQQMAAMSKQAAVRTVGVVGDDLAISCNQLIGGQPERKLPMVMKVVKGSLKNKAIMIPCALALSATFPGAIVPALTVGGALLCFDSVDKIIHKKLKPIRQPNEAEDNDHAAWEQRHVKRALRTDLLLSAEITTVSLWTVMGAPFLVQLAAMAAAGVAMTAGVYGIVGGLIKFDDVGAALTQTPGRNIASKALRGIGKAIVHAAPPLIKTIGLLGTAAMFFVGGGMLVNGIPGGGHILASAVCAVSSSALVQGVLTVVGEAAVGLLSGFAAIPVAKVVLPPYRKAVALGKTLVKKVRVPMQVTVTPPAGDPPASALKSVPDAKASLNAAAARPANDNQSAAQSPAPAKGPKNYAP